VILRLVKPVNRNVGKFWGFRGVLALAYAVLGAIIRLLHGVQKVGVNRVGRRPIFCIREKVLNLATSGLPG